MRFLADRFENRDIKSIRDLFRTNYRMDFALANLKKPCIVFMNGFTFGGGGGISLAARYRIATEKCVSNRSTKRKMASVQRGPCPKRKSATFQIVDRPSSFEMDIKTDVIGDSCSHSVGLEFRNKQSQRYSVLSTSFSLAYGTLWRIHTFHSQRRSETRNRIS